MKHTSVLLCRSISRDYVYMLYLIHDEFYYVSVDTNYKQHLASQLSANAMTARLRAISGQPLRTRFGSDMPYC